MLKFINCTIVILILVVVYNIWTVLRFRSIASSRRGENFATFRLSLNKVKIPKKILYIVYKKFQEYCNGVRDFPVQANDDICKIYGIAGSDLDDALTEVLEACGREWPSRDQILQMLPIVTVKDFAEFVSKCPLL